MEPGLALVRDLQQEVLARMLRPDEDDERTLVVLVDDAGLRWWSTLPEPGPEDHRIAHLEREVGALVAARAPIALAVGTPVRGVPEPHETLVIWSAEQGGETLAVRVHTILTFDGQLVPGPLGTLDALESAFADTCVAALRGAG